MFIVNNQIMHLSLFDFMCLYITVRLMYILIFNVKMTLNYLLLPTLISVVLSILVVIGVINGYYNAFIQLMALFLLGLSSLFCCKSYVSSLNLSEVDNKRLQRKAYIFVAEILLVAYLLALFIKGR